MIPFILTNWRWLGGALAGLLLAGLVWGHFHHDAKIRVDLATAQSAERQAKADGAQWAALYRTEKGAVEAQNAQIARLGAEAAQWQARAQAATAEAHRANLKAQASAAAFLAIKPKGATVCERADDVSARIDEDLK